MHFKNCLNEKSSLYKSSNNKNKINKKCNGFLISTLSIAAFSFILFAHASNFPALSKTNDQLNLKISNSSGITNSIISSTNKKVMHSIQEYILDNGLKVLIKEDHSAPIVAQNIFFRVGSRNDPKGQSGISHYLEHMQFNGTATRKKGEISEEIEKRGGTFNAATSTDFTMYYITLPSEHLNFALELEADRMRNSIINEEEATRERKVVLAELSGGENNPMTLLSRQVLKEVYSEHPYGIPIIGWQTEVENLSVENLKAHYDNYYEPNNAVLILIGDLDPAKTLEQVKATFGKIPASKKTLPQEPKASKDQNKKIAKTVEVKSPSETLILNMVWNGVSFKDKDYPALSVLAAILSNGNLSRLEKALVDSGKANYVSASVRQGIDPFTFSITTLTSQNGNLNELQEIIEHEIKFVQQQGVTEGELQKVKAKAQTGYLFGLEDPSDLATQIGFFEVVSGDWKRTFSWADDIEAVTLDDVKRVANQYLDLKKVTLGKLIHDDNAIGSVQAANPADMSVIAHYKSEGSLKKENLVSGTLSKTSKGIQAKEVKLDNGLKIVLRHNTNNPVIAIAGTVDAGEVFDNSGRQGISGLTGLMLERGNQRYDRDSFNEALEQIGAEIEISPEKDYVSISAKSRAKDYDKLIELLAEEIINPTFPQDELDKLKMQLILDLEQSKDEMSHLGKIAYYQSIFPQTHPYYEIGIEEQIQIVNAANQKELIDFHKAYYKPERLILAISGDFEEKEIINSIKKHFAAFGDSIKASNNKANTYNVPAIPLNEAGKTKEIQVPGKSQAVVMLGHAGQINRTHPDFYALLLANDILGGGSSLSSRLGKRVREEAGLVYYIGSSFNMGRGVGPFTVKMGVAPNKIDEAVKLTKEEIEKFQKGDISDEEFEKSKSYLSGAFISHNLTSNESVASSLRLYEMWGLDLNTINEYPNKIKALKKEDVIKAAQKYIHPDKLQMVIVKPK